MLVRQLLQVGRLRLIGHLVAPARGRALERHAELQRRTRALERELGDDPEALRRAQSKTAREFGSGCLRSLAPSAALGLLEPLSVFLSPPRQSLIERAAGVVLIRKR